MQKIQKQADTRNIYIANISIAAKVSCSRQFCSTLIWCRNIESNIELHMNESWQNDSRSACTYPTRLELNGNSVPFFQQEHNCSTFLLSSKVVSVSYTVNGFRYLLWQCDCYTSMPCKSKYVLPNKLFSYEISSIFFFFTLFSPSKCEGKKEGCPKRKRKPPLIGTLLQLLNKLIL